MVGEVGIIAEARCFFGMAGVDSLFVGLYLVSFPSALFLGTQSIPNSITRFRPYSVFLFFFRNWFIRLSLPIVQKRRRSKSVGPLL